jgi:hypothetical protein
VARPPESSPEQRTAFAQALAEELMERHLSQASFTNLLALSLDPPPHQTTVSNWLGGKTEPLRSQVFAIEAMLNLAPGSISRHLGYLPVDAVPAVETTTAISQDVALSPGQRDDLAAQYRTMVERTTVRRQQRPRPSER